MTTEIEHQRISENLAFIAANPTARYPQGWIAEVQAEARAIGLLKPLETQGIGSNCRPGIDSRITYGGDMIEVF